LPAVEEFCLSKYLSEYGLVLLLMSAIEVCQGA
jgi:hypothetical protein